MISRLPALLLGPVRARCDQRAFDDAAEKVVSELSAYDEPISLFRPELGAVALGVTRFQREGVTDEWILGQFGIAAFVSGGIKQFNSRFTGTHPLCVAGCLIKADTFDVHGADGVLVVKDWGGNVLAQFVRHDRPGPALWCAESNSSVISAGSMSSILTTNGGWSDSWGAQERVNRPSDTESFKSHVQDAFALLEEMAPEYYLWTAAVLREIAPRARIDGRTIASCSYTHYFGGIEICTPANILETVEMLVHECSHLYYHLCSWFTKTLKDHTTEAFSVLKGTARPLDKILLGYHAFANVALMYRKLQQINAPVDAVLLEERKAQSERFVQELYIQLVNNQASLSSSGYAIFQSLAKELTDNEILEERELEWVPA